MFFMYYNSLTLTTTTFNNLRSKEKIINYNLIHILIIQDANNDDDSHLHQLKLHPTTLPHAAAVSSIHSGLVGLSEA